MIETTLDSLRVFQCCREGKLGRIRRRLYERERKLIRSGSVFVFNEGESGIKRWTDGRLWSPSRIYGNFLIYRELESKKAAGAAAGSREALAQVAEEEGQRGPQNDREPEQAASSTSALNFIESVLHEAAAAATATEVPAGSAASAPEMIQWMQHRASLLDTKFKNSIRKLGSQNLLVQPRESSGLMPADGSAAALAPFYAPGMEAFGVRERCRPETAAVGRADMEDMSALFDHYFENGFPGGGTSIAATALPREAEGAFHCPGAALPSGTEGRPPPGSQAFPPCAAPKSRHRRFKLKADGLIKKTISVVMDNQTYHLVCYYSKKDFMLGRSNLSPFPKVPNAYSKFAFFLNLLRRCMLSCAKSCCHQICLSGSIFGGLVLSCLRLSMGPMARRATALPSKGPLASSSKTNAPPARDPVALLVSTARRWIIGWRRASRRCLTVVHRRWLALPPAALPRRRLRRRLPLIFWGCRPFEGEPSRFRRSPVCNRTPSSRRAGGKGHAPVASMPRLTCPLLPVITRTGRPPLTLS
jgi:hypothetical protein